jgi:hypothetical protein
MGTRGIQKIRNCVTLISEKSKGHDHESISSHPRVPRGERVSVVTNVYASCHSDRHELRDCHPKMEMALMLINRRSVRRGLGRMKLTQWKNSCPEARAQFSKGKRGAQQWSGGRPTTELCRGMFGGLKCQLKWNLVTGSGPGGPGGPGELKFSHRRVHSVLTYAGVRIATEW